MNETLESGRFPAFYFFGTSKQKTSMFVYVGLSVVGMAIALLLLFKFRKKSVDEYDKDAFEGSSQRW